MKLKKEVIEFEVVNFHGAGIDIGSREIYVSIDGVQVVSFKTFSLRWERTIVI